MSYTTTNVSQTKRWCRIKRTWCLMANLNGNCMVTACPYPWNVYNYCPNCGAKMEVEKVMDAKEFIRELVRMCKSKDDTCNDCQIRQRIGCPLIIPENVDADMLVDVIEKWSKEHPLITNGDVLKEMLPDGSSVNDQYNAMADHIFIEVPKDWWKAEYKGAAYGD